MVVVVGGWSRRTISASNLCARSVRDLGPISGGAHVVEKSGELLGVGNGLVAPLLPRDAHARVVAVDELLLALEDVGVAPAQMELRLRVVDQ